MGPYDELRKVIPDRFWCQARAGIETKNRYFDRSETPIRELCHSVGAEFGTVPNRWALTIRHNIGHL
jgi:hypothetical protein